MGSSQPNQSAQSLSGWPQDDRGTAAGIQEVDNQMRKSINLKKKRAESIPDVSDISETGQSQLLGPGDMQNPQGESQGEEEEAKGELLGIIAIEQEGKGSLERLT